MFRLAKKLFNFVKDLILKLIDKVKGLFTKKKKRCNEIDAIAQAVELAKVNGLKIEIKSSITDYTDVEMFRDFTPITREEIIKQALKEIKEKKENATIISNKEEKRENR